MKYNTNRSPIPPTTEEALSPATIPVERIAEFRRMAVGAVRRSA